MKLWITGAEGLVGSALLRSCQRHGIEAVGTSKLQADITQPEMLKAAAHMICPTHIIHCAAYTNVDHAERTPRMAFAINAEGTANMAQVAKEFGAQFIHISTDYVFSGTQSRPYKEEDPCAPINIYGRSKWEGEKKVVQILKEACIIRTSWVFGSKGKNFISSLLKSFQEKKELHAVCDQYNRPTYGHDLAEAILSLLNAQGVFHFANTGEKSRYQIAVDVLESMKKKGIPHLCQKIVPVSHTQFPTVAPRPTYTVLDTTKYFHHTHLKPRSWSEVLNEFLHYDLSV